MKILLSLYGNCSQVWKISENIIEENCLGYFEENFWKFVEIFSGIFGTTLLIFLENLVIFCWGGGGAGKLLEIFGAWMWWGDGEM